MVDRNSPFLLGLRAEDVRRLEPVVGGPVAPFFALAQRCVWGVAQPDLVKVDVDEVRRRLLQRYPQCMASHLLCAFALAKSAPTEAAEAVERARALCAPDHPWRHLLPSAWPPAPPQAELTEVVPGQLWRVHGFLSMAGTPFYIASTCTVVRSERGELTLVNPCPLSPQAAEAIGALGEVRWVVSQGKAHSRFVESVRELFPGSRALGTRGHLQHPASRHLRFDGLLDDGDCELTPELERLPFSGISTEEVALLHRPSGCLILQDAVTHALASNTARGFGGFVYYFGHGVVGRIGLASYNMLLWDDLRALQQSVRALLGSGFTSAVGAHWPLRPATGDDLEAMRTALRWLLQITPLEHRRLQAAYFARLPGFLIDLVRYKRAQRREAAAR